MKLMKEYKGQEMKTKEIRGGKEKRNRRRREEKKRKKRKLKERQVMGS